MKVISLDDLKTDLDKTDFIKKYIKEDNELNLSINYKSDFTNTKIIRNYISEISDYFCLPWNWKTRLILIVDELNNNAIEYGSKENSDNIINIFFKDNNNWVDVNIEVEDSWDWQSSKSAEDMILLKEEKISTWYKNHKWIRWRWLFQIIYKLVDDLYFKDSEKWWLIVGINKTIAKEEV